MGGNEAAAESFLYLRPIGKKAHHAILACLTDSRDRFGACFGRLVQGATGMLDALLGISVCPGN